MFNLYSTPKNTNFPKLFRYGYKFNLIEGNEIEIQLCSAFESNDRLRVTLSQKNRDGNYKYIFDLTKKGRVNKKILIKLYTDNQDFEGYFNQFNKLNDGDYLFSIYANNSCGEIIFKVKNNKKVSEEFLCINYCS